MLYFRSKQELKCIICFWFYKFSVTLILIDSSSGTNVPKEIFYRNKHKMSETALNPVLDISRSILATYTEFIIPIKENAANKVVTLRSIIRSHFALALSSNYANNNSSFHSQEPHQSLRQDATMLRCAAHLLHFRHWPSEISIQFSLKQDGRPAKHPQEVTTKSMINSYWDRIS